MAGFFIAFNRPRVRRFKAFKPFHGYIFKFDIKAALQAIYKGKTKPASYTRRRLFGVNIAGPELNTHTQETGPATRI